MLIEFLLEDKKTENLDIKEVLINIKFSNERSFSEILTEIRAIKGVTVISIIAPSRLVSGDPHSSDSDKTYFATIKIKMEISNLEVKNYIKFINDNIKRIKGVMYIQIKKKIIPKVSPRKAQEIKSLLTI